MVIQTFGMMQEEVLAAVPLFIFMGTSWSKRTSCPVSSEPSRYLLGALEGLPLPRVIFTATIFAMATGIVGAAVTVLGSWRPQS